MKKNARTRTAKRLSSAQPKQEQSAAQAPSNSEVVLLAVIGMSPAILTETIWALAAEQPPVIPDRIVVVTTLQGREQVKQLFAETSALKKQSPWNALRQALEQRGHNLKGKLRFGATANDIRVITGHDKTSERTIELNDIRDRADNEAAADFLLEQVRTFVENPDIQLIVSIAGGRKTLSALMYACVTLAGRETDRLTHVLVSEPFETLRDFWFPHQPGGALKDRDGHEHDPKSAKVELAHVPFVPLRNLFRRELGQPAGSFRRLIDVCLANVRLTAGERLGLQVEMSHPRTNINGRVLELSPREHLLLLFFAQRAKRGETVLSAYDEALVELEETRQKLRASAPANNWSDWRNSESLSAELTERDLVRIISDIRRKAKQAGSDAAFLADVLPAKGRCALDIPASNISIK